MRATREEFIAEMLALFRKHGPMTIKQMASALDCAHARIERRVKIMRDLRLIRVCGHNYRPNNGTPEIILDVGGEKDARPREKTDDRISQKKYRDKIKAEQPDRYRKKIVTFMERQKERLKDPAYKEKFLEKRRIYEREYYGHRPASFLDRKTLDHIAMQFGITWRFKCNLLQPAV